MALCVTPLACRAHMLQRPHTCRAGGGLLEFLLLGALIAMVRVSQSKRQPALMAIADAQVSEYWERYGDLDGWKLKSTVWLMLVLNILRSGQCFTMLWHKVRKSVVAFLILIDNPFVIAHCGFR